MKVLIVYDSFYGNTLKAAEMFQKEFELKNCEVELMHVTKVDFGDFAKCDLLILGSPTRGFRATQPMALLLKNKSIDYVGKKTFIFDTRIDPSDIKSKLLKKMMNSFGYGTTHLQKLLLKRGGKLVTDSQGYAVVSSEGPLKPDVAYEIEMAVNRIMEVLLQQ